MKPGRERTWKRCILKMPERFLHQQALLLSGFLFSGMQHNSARCAAASCTEQQRSKVQDGLP